MTTCILSVLLFIFPIASHEPDNYDSEQIDVRGCNNKIDRLWIKSHTFYIETDVERIEIPLPPVADYTEFWMVFDFQRDRVRMGNWGNVHVRRGPKEPI